MTYSIVYGIPFSQTLLIISVLIAIPMVMDGFTQLLGERESTNFIRLITGFFAGIGVVVFVNLLGM